MAYTGLLDRILEDRRIDDQEAESLLAFAEDLAISGSQIRLLHHGYLQRLASAAVADGTVTDLERQDLFLVADLLGLERPAMDGLLEEAAQIRAQPGEHSPPATGSLTSEDARGKRVCFTGESQCRFQGAVVSRQLATEIATRYGMIVVESVTRKLDILVVADPYTQSGKAKKARQYGIRVIHEPVFWGVLGLQTE